MAARSGFNRKLLPLYIEQDTGQAYSGGRYLFDTYENAVAFADWCANDFEIDGILILERPDFADVRAQIYRVIGAHDFKDVHTRQIAYRTEIWKTNKHNIEDKLTTIWPTLRDRADEEGKSSLWLLHNENAGEVALVTIIDRVSEKLVGELDYLTLNALESATSYGNDWNWGNRIFDRSHWVFTVWFPNTGDSSDKPPLWPNSPPLPAPVNIASEKSVA